MPERNVGGPGVRGRQGARGSQDRPPIAPAEGPRPVAASLPEVARRIGGEGAVELAAVRAAWPAVVGEAAAAHAWPKSLVTGVLTVATDHHAWATELRLLSAELLERLRPVSPSVRVFAVVVSPREGPDW